MLKTAAFALAFSWVAAGYARGSERAATLVVGVVRDQTGAPIVGAAVRALAASERALGSDATAADGTFALDLTAPAAALVVDCAHCKRARLALRGRTNVALIVTRYAALESDTPTSSDLAALPYGRIVDDLALVPFVLPSRDGRNASDRGLGAGRGLVVDDGVPLVDLANGSSALGDFPDRYVRTVDIARADRAFRYGSYAAGGVFSLDRRSDDTFWGSADLGGSQSLVVAPKIGIALPGFGASDDDGTTTRRGDLDLQSGFAGGVLRAGAAAGSNAAPFLDGAELTQHFALAHLAYATASRRYRTFLSAAAADIDTDEPDTADYRASYLDLDARLEHPGPVPLAFGIALRRETAGIGFYESAASAAEHADEANAYAEASLRSARGSLAGGLGLSGVAVRPSLGTRAASLGSVALLPALSGRLELGGGVYARLGYSQGVRVPTLTEYGTAPPSSIGNGIESSELLESALGFDPGGRLRAEAIAFRENAYGFAARRLEGLGASLVWQLAPLVSLRAWSLQDDSSALARDVALPNVSSTDVQSAMVPTANALPALVDGFYGTYLRSRQVLWATYANGDGLRADAIVRRDGALRGGALSLDGDVYVPVGRTLALDAGTSRQTTARRYYLGLRTR